jgi:hypothetical protein
MPTLTTLAQQVLGARETTIDRLGCQVTLEAAIRQPRQPGEGYLRKARSSFGPYTAYVYWAGGANAERGNQGGELLRQDRDATWGASFKLDDGLEMWPDGILDAQSEFELIHPVYGRFRLERIQQMSIQGANVGFQAGLERVS